MKKLPLIVVSALCMVTTYAETRPPEKEKVKYARVQCNDEKFGVLAKGGRAFSDHPMPLSHVPDQFDGDQMVIRVNGDKRPLDFSVKRAGLVTIITVAGLRSTFLDLGWDEVDHALLNKEPASQELPIFQKFLDEGEYSLPVKGWFGTRLIKM